MEEQRLKRLAQEELAKHLDHIAHLEQSTPEKIILYLNLVIIVCGAVALYVYFSINPFSPEEIAKLRANLTTGVN